MTNDGKSTTLTVTDDVNQVKATVSAEPNTDRETNGPIGLAERLALAAETCRRAAVDGLAAPADVTVTEHGCTALMDTEALLEWAGLYSPRPVVTTFADSAHIALDGAIGGQPWRLHNGEPEPAHQRPWDALRAAAPSPTPRHAITPEPAPEPASA
jgi:hypothetical protein